MLFNMQQMDELNFEDEFDEIKINLKLTVENSPK